jgi:hypothetical protein
MLYGDEIAAAQPRRFGKSELADIQREEFRRYVGYCLAGRRAPSALTVSSPVLDEGQVLVATDRGYRVTSKGWQRVETDKDMPAHKSQIRLLVKPRGKYPKATAAKESAAPAGA